MTLLEAKEAFSAWRQAKGYPSEPIPEDLWVRVRSLVAHHSRKEICAVLSINPKQFDIRCAPKKTVLKNVSEPAFVTVPIPKETFLKKESCEVVLQGERKKLIIYLSEESLRSILPVLQECL